VSRGLPDGGLQFLVLSRNIDPIAFFRELAHLAATKFSDIALRRVVLNDPKSFDRNLSWPQIIGLSTPPQMAYASHEDDSLHR
jgi:hypothetical protein